MSPTAPQTALYRWDTAGGVLELITTPVIDFGVVVVADSWPVTDGTALALTVHRDRFLSTAVPAAAHLEPESFFDAAIRMLPRTGNLFPRVDLRIRGSQSALLLSVRPAPERTASVVLQTHAGADPRRVPTVKGPDLEALGLLRTAAAESGVDEVVILSPDGFVIDGAYSALAWWHGNTLCVPDADLARVDSVTARTLVTLATALGVDVLHERVRPIELDGREVWTLNALQGIRIVREWRDGPAVAAEPGRLALWRERLATLRRPLPA